MLAMQRPRFPRHRTARESQQQPDATTAASLLVVSAVRITRNESQRARWDIAGPDEGAHPLRELPDRFRRRGFVAASKIAETIELHAERTDRSFVALRQRHRVLEVHIASSRPAKFVGASINPSARS